MLTLQVDDKNNLVLDKKSLQVISGIDACAQDTKTRVGLCLGEDPYDTTVGADYFNELLGKMGGEDYIREVISMRILDSEEITAVNSVEFDKSGDHTAVTANITTIYGAVEL